MLLHHIEDRDLWRFALPQTRAIQANVFSYPYDFNVWDELMSREVSELAIEGTAIERKHFKDLNELIRIVTVGNSLPRISGMDLQNVLEHRRSRGATSP